MTDLHLPACNDINARAEKIFKKASNCDFFLFGGDNLMAIDHQSEDKIQAQFDNWRRFTKKHVRKPYRSVLGNHDIEMWTCPNGSRGCGKQRAIELFNMKNRYWEDKVGGWRIIGLDTIQPRRSSYIGHVDREQMKWLENVLASDTKTPTIVLGHIPLLSVTSLADSTAKANPLSMSVSFCSQIGNAREVIHMFREAGNIKMCLSGHAHMVDRCDFAGTSYLCGGSVSGSWWRGPHQGFAPSYTQIDLMGDGSFETKTIVCG